MIYARDPSLGWVLAFLAFTKSVEGPFTDNADDPGNWTGGKIGVGELKGTAWGISAAIYPKLDIAKLSWDDAAVIYERDFCNQLPVLPLPWALATADAAVNSGHHEAISFLQTALRGAGHYTGNIDGDAGELTIAAIGLAQKAITVPTRNDLTGAMISARSTYDIEIGDGNFIEGWENRLVALALYCAW